MKYLKTYYPGEAFGELALLYNAPRAATIKVKTSAVLFALDRQTFNNIVK
jgi:cAMP-dependent protein kinase regulator